MMAANPSQQEATNLAPTIFGFSGWNNKAVVRLYFHTSEMQRQGGLRGIYRMCSFNGNETVLDYGCGDGKISSTISHHLYSKGGKVIGVDISEDMVAFASARFPPSEYPNLSFITDPTGTCDPGHVGHPDGSVDAIVSSFAFHLVPDKPLTLSNMLRLLKPGGRLALAIPTISSVGDHCAKNYKALSESIKEVALERAKTAKEVTYIEPKAFVNVHSEKQEQLQSFLVAAGYVNIDIQFNPRAEHFYGAEELGALWFSGAPAMPQVKGLNADDWQEIARKVISKCPEDVDPKTGFFAWKQVDCYVSANKA